ncbi:beta-N-acetylhexosaminidase [uncultured Cohaesibacter sp.]|uniref:beta-N-acetylhexosaminidase n=1 Tax=uncultured Cohaesibacter sp. TaxID=1002546 RepID=UPI0029C6DEA5|nr:beta-N-acetylhexosaminidase [uncultured Cohaesibacter sp.]
MAEPAFKLASSWIEDDSRTGQTRLRLYASEAATLSPDSRLAFTSITRIPPGTGLIGARYVSRTANYHEVAPETPVMLGGDDCWEIIIPVLSHKPNHCTDGPKSAFLILPGGETVGVTCEALLPESLKPHKLSSGASPAPESIARRSPLLGLLPMANHIAIERWSETCPSGFLVEASETVSNANDLFGRLFPGAVLPFGADAAGIPLHLDLFSQRQEGQGASVEGYELTFTPQGITLVAQANTGLFYGLVALAQIWQAASTTPERFVFPLEGRIVDEPAHEWRGMHLDVSRQVYGKSSILDFLDRLAWHRLNRFHWHLTDDEGWRLESRRYPGLTQVGAWRGHRLPLLPQHGSGAARHGGFFSQQDIRDVVAHAERLQIEVVPEIDVPGHCYAALASVPALVDPSAMAGGSSVQGYVNNALNPGLSATWTFLDRIFGEVCDLFPGSYVHMGGDEVAEAAWAGSRSAASWARAKGHVDDAGNPDSMKMQAAILRFVSDRIVAAGKTPLAWEEAARGGGLDPDQAILMAWMKAESGPELVAKGYRVIMCPGEAYYLDMAQSDAWDEPGLSWAGTSSPEQTYHFDPLSGFADSAQVMGLQGCIWSENLVSRALFNHMVFPRLSAIAESGWTTPGLKDWLSFAARSPLIQKMPPVRD